MTTFKHEWQSSMNLEAAWNLIVRSFEDSTKSPVWPNRLATLHAHPSPLRPGSLLAVQYKFGPLAMDARYRIARLEPLKVLRYETESDHPLIGGAEISVSALPSGTQFKWEGEYRAKTALGWPALVWFKGFYEGRFFAALTANFRKATS